MPDASPAEILAAAADRLAEHAGCLDAAGDSGTIALAEDVRRLAEAFGPVEGRLAEIHERYDPHNRPEVDEDISWLLLQVERGRAEIRVLRRENDRLTDENVAVIEECEELRRAHASAVGQLDHQIHGRDHE